MYTKMLAIGKSAFGGKKILLKLATAAALAASLVWILPFGATAAAPAFDATGSYVVAFNYSSVDYPHDMSLTQDGLGNLTGGGGYLAGNPHTYDWVIDSGSVSGNVIHLETHYTLGAVCSMTIDGTIAPGGTMSGTWSDDCSGPRSGAWATTSGAATPFLIVDDNGVECPGAAYTTIQAAVNAASSGDTVTVCAGTYAEQVVISGKSLTVQGAGDTTVIKPSSAAALTSIYTTGTQAGAFFNGMRIASVIDVRGVGTSTVTLRDLKVDGDDINSLPAGADWVSGITFGETGGLVDNVTVEDTNQVVPSSVRTYSMWFDAVGVTPVSVEVTGSRALLFGRNGINARGDSMTVDINNNTVTGPGTVGPDQVPNGILLISGTGGEVADNTISANHYTGATFLGSGVLLFQARDGIAVSGNEVFDTDDAVIINATDLATIEDNNLHNNVKGVRIEAGSAAGNTLTKNLIVSSSLVGIEVSDSAGAGNTASRNAITGNTVGVSNLNAAGFDATCNWWGHLSGPGPVGPGSGDTVSTNVTFSSWLTTSDLSGPCNGPLPPVTVTIGKYIDGAHADVTNAEGESFPMSACWNATNIGAGCGNFNLGPVGFNNPNPYEATTSLMTPGAEYSVSETTGDPSVGAVCADGKPFALVGYSWGDSEALAAAMAPTSTSPSLTNIVTNKFIIVWNKDCTPKLTVTKVVINDNGGTATTSDFTLFVDSATTTSGTAMNVSVGAHVVSEANLPGYTATIGGDCDAGGNVSLAAGESKTCVITNDDTPPDVKVTIIKYVNWVHATAGNTNSASFPMDASWDADNIGAGSGSFALSTVGFNNPTPYEATTADMTSGADYSTNEDLSTPVVGTVCGAGKPFMLVGYTVGDTLAEAESAPFLESDPVLSGITTDKYIIVWNNICPDPVPAVNACAAPLPFGWTLVNGLPGNDDVELAPYSKFVGNGGNDKVKGLLAGDYIVCTGSGNDTITLASGNFWVEAGSGKNTVKTANGNGTIKTGSGNDTIITGSGSHTITAGDGKNVITTGSGNDTITGGTGVDVISAGSGQNTVTALGGKDIVITGSGNDTIDGGVGPGDICVAGGGINTVTNCP